MADGQYKVIIGIDPGRDKCGLAVLTLDEAVLERAVVATTEIPDRLHEIVAKYQVEALVMGDGTGANELREKLAHLQAQGSISNLVLVDEYMTSVEARGRYLAEHPPQGWRRWLPRTLLVPAGPVDDYVAIILAERYLRGKR